MTECHTQPLLFQPHGRREVLADFDGGKITSDAGGLLLREVEERFGILRQFAGGVAFSRGANRVPCSCRASSMSMPTQLP